MLLQLRWQSILDFLVLALALYVVLGWARKAQALRLALIIAGLHAAAILARHFELFITGWILEAAALLSIVLMILVFRTELRHAFLSLDALLRPRPAATVSQTFRSISKAAFDLAATRTGALVVVVRRDSVEELIDGAVSLHADVTSQLLESIFQKTSPLHDGAVVVSGDRLVSANGVLPLTDRTEVPPAFGTRHRAAMGLAERCDALVLAVSEERGEVSLMVSREVLLQHSREELAQAFQKLRVPRQPGFKGSARRAVFSDLRVKFAALAIAAVIWAMSYLVPGTSVRTVSVPVQFNRVPQGLVISEQSADRLEVQIRGSSWVMDSMSPSRLVAQFDLRDAKPGWQRVAIGTDTIGLPSGIIMERVFPQRLSVHLVRQSRPNQP